MSTAKLKLSDDWTAVKNLASGKWSYYSKSLKRYELALPAGFEAVTPELLEQWLSTGERPAAAVAPTAASTSTVTAISAPAFVPDPRVTAAVQRFGQLQLGSEEEVDPGLLAVASPSSFAADTTSTSSAQAAPKGDPCRLPNDAAFDSVRAAALAMSWPRLGSLGSSGGSSGAASDVTASIWQRNIASALVSPDAALVPAIQQYVATAPDALRLEPAPRRATVEVLGATYRGTARAANVLASLMDTLPRNAHSEASVSNGKPTEPPPLGPGSAAMLSKLAAILVAKYKDGTSVLEEAAEDSGRAESLIKELLSQEAWRKAFLELSNRPQQTENGDVLLQYVVDLLAHGDSSAGLPARPRQAVESRLLAARWDEWRGVLESIIMDHTATSTAGHDVATSSSAPAQHPYAEDDVRVLGLNEHVAAFASHALAVHVTAESSSASAASINTVADVRRAKQHLKRAVQTASLRASLGKSIVSERGGGAASTEAASTNTLNARLLTPAASASFVAMEPAAADQDEEQLPPAAPALFRLYESAAALKAIGAKFCRSQGGAAEFYPDETLPGMAAEADAKASVHFARAKSLAERAATAAADVAAAEGGAADAAEDPAAVAAHWEGLRAASLCCAPLSPAEVDQILLHLVHMHQFCLPQAMLEEVYERYKADLASVAEGPESEGYQERVALVSTARMLFTAIPFVVGSLAQPDIITLLTHLLFHPEIRLDLKSSAEIAASGENPQLTPASLLSTALGFAIHHSLRRCHWSLDPVKPEGQQEHNNSTNHLSNGTPHATTGVGPGSTLASDAATLPSSSDRDGDVTLADESDRSMSIRRSHTGGSSSSSNYNSTATTPVGGGLGSISVTDCGLDRASLGLASGHTNTSDASDDGPDTMSNLILALDRCAELVKRRGKGGLANFGQLDAAMGMGDGDAPAAAVPTGIHTAHPTVAGAAATAAEAANAASRDVAELLLLASAFPVIALGTLHWARHAILHPKFVADPKFVASARVLTRLGALISEAWPILSPSVLCLLRSALLISPKSLSATVVWEFRDEVVGQMAALARHAYALPVLEYVLSQVDKWDVRLLRRFLARVPERPNAANLSLPAAALLMQLIAATQEAINKGNASRPTEAKGGLLQEGMEQVCLDLWSGHRTKTTYSSERLTPLQRKQVTALQTSYERWNKGKA